MGIGLPSGRVARGAALLLLLLPVFATAPANAARGRASAAAGTGGSPAATAAQGRANVAAGTGGSIAAAPTPVTLTGALARLRAIPAASDTGPLLVTAIRDAGKGEMVTAAFDWCTDQLRQESRVGIVVIAGYLVGFRFLFLLTLGVLLWWLVKYVPLLAHDLRRRWKWAGVPLAVPAALLFGVPLTWRYAEPGEKRLLKEFLLFFPALLFFLAVVPYLVAAQTDAFTAYARKPMTTDAEFYLKLWSVPLLVGADSVLPWKPVIATALGLGLTWLLIGLLGATPKGGLTAFWCGLCGVPVCGECCHELQGAFLCAACHATRLHPGEGEAPLRRKLIVRRWLAALLSAILPGYALFVTERRREAVTVLALVAFALAFATVPFPWVPDPRPETEFFALAVFCVIMLLGAGAWLFGLARAFRFTREQYWEATPYLKRLLAGPKPEPPKTAPGEPPR